MPPNKGVLKKLKVNHLEALKVVLHGVQAERKGINNNYHYPNQEERSFQFGQLWGSKL